ncbi:hypothetical protein XENOCAPTIV_021771, partial [Xenoophorus captivus]
LISTSVLSLGPPANFPDSVVDSLPADVSTGIYYGWACVGNSDIHKMVTSIGWNPYYKNTKKSMCSYMAPGRKVAGVYPCLDSVGEIWVCTLLRTPHT